MYLAYTQPMKPRSTLSSKLLHTILQYENLKTVVDAEQAAYIEKLWLDD